MADAHELIALTADIVSAHVSNNAVQTSDLPGLITSIHGALSQLGQPAEAEAPKLTPAVAVRASVKPDYIVCLEDGKKLKMLKRYLRTNYDMSPAEYRERWGLPRDYPMVAPAYAETRKELAMKIGLGRKPVDAKPVSTKADAKLNPPAKSKAPAKPRVRKAAGEVSQPQSEVTKG